MKKFISLLLAASISAACGVHAFAEKEERFSDISDKNYAWAKEYIELMAEEGYINGYEDGTYRPDNEVTRLETIVLFARVMGSGKGENSDVVEYALEEYADVINSADINFGEEEVAYMLYRGALTKADVEKYLSTGKAAKPMPRQEAAAIITKAFCGEEAAKSEVLIDLDYNDAKKIDPDYSQYVYYASEMGILNGMDDGNFSPDTSVLRSQVAVMLYRTVEKMNLYIETVLVPSIDTELNNITIVDEEGADISIGYEEHTKFYKDGELMDETDFVNSSMAMLTYINSTLVYVDMFEKVIDETAKGVYQGSDTTDGITTVSIMNAETEKVSDFEISSGAVIKNESGSTVTTKNIAVGSYVEYDLTNGKIIRLEQISKTSKVTGATVKSVDIEDKLYLTISHDDEEYDGLKFVLTDEVLVYKNGDREELSKVYAGDRIEITLEYGNVTKLVAESNTNSYQGTISEIVISQQPSIKIKDGSDIESFDVIPAAVITLAGEAATLYDLRVGDSVKVTVESGVVLKIAATKGAEAGAAITGVVEYIDKSTGFIKVNGETIFCNDSTTTFITANGDKKVMKDLSEGDVVSVRGSLKIGTYTASLIVIE